MQNLVHQRGDIGDVHLAVAVQVEGVGALYGAEEWYDLSLGKKAAAMLLSDFLEYYDE